MTFLGTGMRESELCNLHRDDAHIEEGCPFLDRRMIYRGNNASFGNVITLFTPYFLAEYLKGNKASICWLTNSSRPGLLYMLSLPTHIHLLIWTS